MVNTLQKRGHHRRDEPACFGTGQRTWVQELHYRTIDRLLIALSVVVFVTTLILKIAGIAELLVP